MNNLEHIAYQEVFDAYGNSYAVWRKCLKPKYAKVWLDIGSAYLVLALILFISTLLPYDRHFLLFTGVVMTALLTGFILAYLALFLHEGGHFNLHPHKRTNDILSHCFLGSLFGTSMKAYRKIHWQHHLHLGTPGDTETSYFNDLNASFLVESFTGIHLLKIMRGKSRYVIADRSIRQQTKRMLVIGAVLNVTFLTVLIFTGFWATAIVWLTGMLVFFPFFATIRQILEHRSELAEAGIDYTKQPHGRISRLFGSGIFSRLFGAAGFNRHMIHHWDPQVSYTRLKDVERFLYTCDTTKKILENSRTSYLSTARKLFH
jgi:fatty acid desaturase